MRILRSINVCSSEKRPQFRNSSEWKKYTLNLLDELTNLSGKIKNLYKLTASDAEMRVIIDGKEKTDLGAKKPRVNHKYKALNVTPAFKKKLGLKLAAFKDLKRIEQKFSAALAAMYTLQNTYRQQRNAKEVEKLEASATAMRKRFHTDKKRIERDIFRYIDSLEKIPGSLEAFAEEVIASLEDIVIDKTGKTRFFDTINKYNLIDFDYEDNNYNAGEVARFTVYLEISGVKDPVKPSASKVNQVYIVISHLIVLGQTGKSSRQTGVNVTYNMLPPEEAMNGWTKILNRDDMENTMQIVMQLLQSAVAPNLIAYYGLNIGGLLSKTELRDSLPHKVTKAELDNLSVRRGVAVVSYRVKTVAAGYREVQHDILQAMQYAGIMDYFLVRMGINEKHKAPLKFELIPHRDTFNLTTETYFKITELLGIEDEDSPEAEEFWEWLEEHNYEVSQF